MRYTASRFLLPCTTLPVPCTGVLLMCSLDCKLFTMYHIAFIIKDILLHYPGIALIAAKGISDHLVV